MQEPTENDQYATYNGLNRPAMAMGIPLMLLLLLGFIGVFGTGLCLVIFGPKGFVFTALIFLCGFSLKMICEKDSNALSVMKMNMEGGLINLRQNIFVVGKDSIIGFDSTGLENETNKTDHT